MIKTSDLYNNKINCCGCEACATVCPKHIIRMKTDYDGFLYPEAFNPDSCIDCKRCLEVCPLKKEYVGPKALKHIGGHIDDDTEVKKSASGGLATALARCIVDKGGIVYGVSYSSDFSETEYVRCDNMSQLESLRGSKYSQERKKEIFNQIRKDLNNKRIVLFFGLPCVVNALKLFLARNFQSLYTVSLICHGPTSPLVQKEYIDKLLLEYKSPIKTFNLRAKPTGWKPYFIESTFEDGTCFSEEFHPSTYGIAFKELKRPSCSKCTFKLDYKKSHIDADLIIGDFHGATPQNFTEYCPMGASQCSALTHKGEELLAQLPDSFRYSEISPRQAIHYNRALGHAIKPRWNRNQFARKLANDGLIAACQLKSIKLIDMYDETIRSTKKLLLKLRNSIFSR